MVRATVKGNIVIAIIQGTIGGVTFWLLGIKGALLWGVADDLPVAACRRSARRWSGRRRPAYLLLTGSRLRRALILVLVGVLVIGLIDNLLRPPLVGKDTRLPDYVVLVSTLGGLSLFGINGFVIGPLIAALFIAAGRCSATSRQGAPRRGAAALTGGAGFASRRPAGSTGGGGRGGGGRWRSSRS